MNEIPKAYNPSKVEDKWYKYWEENGLFKGEEKSEKAPFCIVIPPPNVTGFLHMGHALNNTLQDILNFLMTIFSALVDGNICLAFYKKRFCGLWSSHPPELDVIQHFKIVKE